MVEQTVTSITQIAQVRRGWLGSLLGLGILAQGFPSVAQISTPSAAPIAQPMIPLNLVHQLSDLNSQAWGYAAVRSLATRYDIFLGYPNHTFRGQRPLSRRELASVLAQVLDKIDGKLLTQKTTAIEQDILTIRRLLDTYGNALVDLRNRLNQIDQRNRILTQQQFSTTSRLNGQAYFALTDSNNARASLISRLRLNLLTELPRSQGKARRGRLVTQVEAGNDGRDAIATLQEQPANVLGTTGFIADGGGIDAVSVSPQIRLRKLYYLFQPTPALEVAIGSNLPPSDFIDRNAFANGTGETFASSFFANNPLIVQNDLDRSGGAGIAAAWQVGRDWTLRTFHAATDAADPAKGLGQNRYQTSVETEYKILDPAIALRLQYTRANVNGTEINAGGVNAEWTVQRPYGIFGVFGRFGLGQYRGFNTRLGQSFNADPSTWAVGIAVQNFLLPGSRAGVAYGQPFISRKLGNATQNNLEAYLGLSLNDRVNLIPTVSIVSNPNNRTGPTLWQWSMRFLYSF